MMCSLLGTSSAFVPACSSYTQTSMYTDGQADSWMYGCGCMLSCNFSFSFGLLIWRKGEGWFWMIYPLEGIKMTIKSPTGGNIRLGKKFTLDRFYP